MDKWRAIHDFWSGFGIPAYDQSSVPDTAEYPYITYSAAVGEFEQVIILTANVWYLSTRWDEISKKVLEIAEGVGQYKLTPIDGRGYLFVYAGTPFAQRIKDENDLIRRVYIVLQAEFFSKN